jgi:hypothetical protein
MKKLFAIIAVLVISVSAFAQSLPDVTVNLNHAYTIDGSSNSNRNYNWDYSVFNGPSYAEVVATGGWWTSFTIPASAFGLKSSKGIEKGSQNNYTLTFPIQLDLHTIWGGCVYTNSRTITINYFDAYNASHSQPFVTINFTNGWEKNCLSFPRERK